MVMDALRNFLHSKTVKYPSKANFSTLSKRSKSCVGSSGVAGT